MAITLSQAKLNVQNDLDAHVIDEFAKSNWLWNNMTFHDVVSPVGGGATMTYSYNRVKTTSGAGFRAINAEYAPSQAEKEQKNVDLKVFGGSFEIDRVIANMGGIADEVEFQMTQKIKAASALWNDTVINGKTAVDANAFDGLDVALTGTSTELKPSSTIDLSTSAKIDENYKMFLDVLDEFLLGLDGTPSFIAGNTKMIAKLRSIARRSAMYQVTKDNFGQAIEMYGTIPFVDLGAKAGSNEPVVKIETSGETSLYVGRLGLDGFHAVSMAGVSPIQSWLPDFKTAGAVKKGEVEMVSAVALKATKAAGVLRKIKVV